MFFLIFFIFNSLSLTASPVCDIPKLETELLFLKINTKTRTNSELESEIKLIYGNATWKYLIEHHPYLNIPEATLDSETIDWIMSAMNVINHNNLQYVWVPMKISPDDQDEFPWFIDQAFSYSIVKGYLTKKYVFVDEVSRSVFRNNMLNDFAEFEETAMEILQGVYPDLTLDHLKRFIKRAYDNLRDPSSTIVGLKNVNKEDNLVVAISAHAVLNVPELSIGDEYITIPELINEIKNANLPSDTSFVLDTCWGACLANEKLPYLSDTVKEKFLTGELQKDIRKMNGSFLDKFALELKEKIPSFKGDISGYLGKILLRLSSCLNETGNYAVDYAVVVSASDGQMVCLEKEAMRFTLSLKSK